MFRGFYTVGSGMIAQQRRTELLTNNLSNAKTPGFKEDQSTIRSFPDMLMSRLDRTNIPTENGFQMKTLSKIGDVGTGVYMQETLPNFAPGSLLQTNNPTDIALHTSYMEADPETGQQGALLFRLENENGEEIYTRNGNFAIDPDGYLTSASGEYVLDSDGQRIYIVDTDFEVSEDGYFITTGGTQLMKLGVAYVNDTNRLVKAGNGLFTDPDGIAQNADTVNLDITYNIQQGFLENSNVDMGETMTDLMTAYRVFEANSKVLQAYDRSMEKAVELGRVQ